MKFTFRTGIPIAFFIFLTLSCGLDLKRGNGEIVQEYFEIEDFNAVNIGGNYEVTLIRSDETKVILKTDENLINYINVELHGQTLNINNVHPLKGSQGISVEVYYKELDKINSSGASNIKHEGVLQTSFLDIDMSGAGAIELEAEAAKTQVNLSGAGLIKLSGETDLMEAQISGAGAITAPNFICKECQITLSGLGGAEVYVTEKLTADITGIGGIVYGGNPKLIEKQVTGFGKINRAEEFVEEENN